MFSFFYSYVSFVQNSNREKWQNEDYEIIEWHAGNYFSIFLIFWLILVGIDKFRLLLINFDCFWWTLIDNQCFLLIVIDSKRLVTHEVAKFINALESCIQRLEEKCDWDIFEKLWKIHSWRGRTGSYWQPRQTLVTRVQHLTIQNLKALDPELFFV